MRTFLLIPFSAAQIGSWTPFSEGEGTVPMGGLTLLRLMGVLMKQRQYCLQILFCCFVHDIMHNEPSHFHPTFCLEFICDDVQSSSK